ncbi:hypothetical protein EB155_14220, partial [archaeon]|nr:hypothetical protein [archaeon]
GRTQLQLIGRYENNNDGWSLSNGRNNIIFATQIAKDATIIDRNAIQSYNGDLGIFSIGYSDGPALVVKSNGNIGIGTTNPSNKLHVANLNLINSQQDLLIIESHTAVSEGGNSILFRNRWNNGSYWNMARITAVEQGGYGGQLIFQTNVGSGSADDTTVEAMRINELGNIGIGTNSPTKKLDVRGSVYIEGNEQNTGVLHVHDNNSHGEPIARFTASGDGLILIENTKSATDYDECGVVIKGSSAGGYWLVGTDDTSALEIKYDASDFHFSGGYGLSVATNGNVGIGTNNPLTKLHILGGGISCNGGHNQSVANEGAHIAWNRSGGYGETWIINNRGAATVLDNSGIKF